MRFFIIGGPKEGHSAFKEAEQHALRLAKDSPGVTITIAKAYAEVLVRHTVTLADPVEAESSGEMIEEYSKPRLKVSAEFLKHEKGEIK